MPNPVAPLTSWRQSVEFITRGIRELAETDFSQVRFGDAGFAWWLAAVVLGMTGLTLARIVLFRRRHSRFHSGFAIDRRFQKPMWIRILYNLPKLAFAGAILLLLVAVADPFLTATEEVAGSMDSRVRIDLVDVSGSMAWEFAHTGKSKAEIAREAHLKFLAMRRNKNDRVSLWLFSTHPYMVDDFVTDAELYYFEVADAPYVMTLQIDRAMIVPRGRVRIIPVEGGSNIVRPLAAITKQLDQDELTSGHSGGQYRAVLIVTDAAVEEFPANELAELHKRNVRPYIILINSSNPDAVGVAVSAVPELVEQIRGYGGDYFDVSDPESLQKAYEAIDAREAVRYQVTHRAFKVPIYPRFLLAGMALLLVGIPLGTLAELFWGTDP